MSDEGLGRPIKVPGGLINTIRSIGDYRAGEGRMIAIIQEEGEGMSQVVLSPVTAITIGLRLLEFAGDHQKAMAASAKVGGRAEVLLRAARDLLFRYAETDDELLTVSTFYDGGSHPYYRLLEDLTEFLELPVEEPALVGPAPKRMGLERTNADSKVIRERTITKGVFDEEDDFPF